MAYRSSDKIVERHRLQVRSLGYCRYEVSWPGPNPDWELEHRAQELLTFHATPSGCFVDQLLFVGSLPEAEACTYYSGPDPMWFRDCIVSNNTLRIGVCPGDCEEIGTDPLVVVYTGFVLGVTLGQVEGRPDYYCSVADAAGAGGGATIADVAGTSGTPVR